MIDELDIGIIRLLEGDNSISRAVVAKQLKSSPTTIRRRINNLLNEGIIFNKIQYDSSKLGLSTTALIAFSVDNHKLSSLSQELAACTQVKWVISTTGRFDVIAFAEFSTTEELYSFILDEISKVPGIRNHETFIILHKEKSGYI